MGSWGYQTYVSVAEKRAKAEKKLKQLRKKTPHIRPVEISGKTIAKTWWGVSWNKNLEKYADYRNRIGRGRSYVRHRAILDLKIDSGKVESLVMGSGPRPYSIEIKIGSIKKRSWEEIRERCEGKLESLKELLDGKISKKLSDIFTAEGRGLFPSPRDISFQCSCPDSAYMCKHVAATLYGVGARLDEEPALFFKLRNVEIDDLVSEAVKSKTAKMLKKTEVKSSRVISDSNLSDIFGIDIDVEKPENERRAVIKNKKKTVGKQVLKKAATKKTIKKTVKKKSDKEKM